MSEPEEGNKLTFGRLRLGKGTFERPVLAKACPKIYI